MEVFWGVRCLWWGGYLQVDKIFIFDLPLRSPMFKEVVVLPTKKLGNSRALLEVRCNLTAFRRNGDLVKLSWD